MSPDTLPVRYEPVAQKGKPRLRARGTLPKAMKTMGAELGVTPRPVYLQSLAPHAWLPLSRQKAPPAFGGRSR